MNHPNDFQNRRTDNWASPKSSPIPACASPEPYPAAAVSEKNNLYGRMMLDNMGGQNSEMSAVSMYVYSNILLKDQEYLARIFRKISIVEMGHLELFAQLARLLGQDPRLWTHRGGRMVYWSPGYNRYGTDPGFLLQTALVSEQSAIEKYEEQCRRIDDPCILSCLRRIIADEEIHVKIFQSLCQEWK